MLVLDLERFNHLTPANMFSYIRVYKPEALARHLYALVLARRDGSFTVKGEIKVAKKP